LHERDILHLDVKPGNVLLYKNGAGTRACLIDFGTCVKVGGRPSMSATRGYAPPEVLQWITPVKKYRQEQPLTRAADVYSLGVMIYYQMAKVKPLDGSIRDESAMDAYLNERPKRLDAVRPEVGSHVSNLVASMLEKRPEDRPTLAEVRSGLERA
jgi:serine/threonine protein kinase